jgi:hypothetical protein
MDRSISEILLAAACLGGAVLLWCRHTILKWRFQAFWRRLEAVLVRHDLPDGTLSVAVAEDGTLSFHPPVIPGHLRLALLSALTKGFTAPPLDERCGIHPLYLETEFQGWPR